MVKNKLWMHIVGWVVLFFYELLIKGRVLEYPENLKTELVFVSIRVLCLAALVYFVLFVLFEKLYFSKKKKYLWVLVPLSILLCAYAMRTFNYFFHWRFHHNMYNSLLEVWQEHLKTIVYFGNITFVLGMAALFYFVDKWIVEERNKQTIITLQKENELKQLKAQIQPHFLFNTLNNIHALAEKKSETTSDAIHKLSSLLESSLYKGKKAWNSVTDELSYIESYVSLEMLRYGERLNFALNNFLTNPDKWRVPTFILLPLVENAFKHGINKTKDKSFLSIEVNENQNTLIIKIENSTNPLLQSEETLNKQNNGLGIQNVRRRLGLLYPNKHTLDFKKGKDSFLVTIQLKSNGTN